MSGEGKSRGLFKFLATLALLDVTWLVFTSSGESPFDTRQIRIALALIICAFAMWPRKVIGSLISWVALLWITLEYILWWKTSMDVVDAAGMSFSHARHFAYLLRGTWWDLCVLLATIIGLVWTSRQLRQAFYERD